MRHKFIDSLVGRDSLLFVAILLFLGGCTALPTRTSQRLFFPPPPVEPKIEWMATYIDQHSFPKTAMQQRLDAILGRAPSVGFIKPMDTASDGKGKIYITDPESRNVYIYDTVKHKVGVLDETGAGTFTLPLGIAVDAGGRIYVADRFRKKVLVFGPNKAPLLAIGGRKDEMEAPVGVAVDSINEKVYVTDVKKQSVNVYNMKGKLLYILDGNRDGRMSFNFPVDVDVLPNGSIAVCDTMNARIHIIDSEGVYVRNFGKRGDAMDSFEMIKAVAVDKEGHIYVADVGSNTIKIFDEEGKLLLIFGGTFKTTHGLAPGGFTMIAGISADSKNGIFVADQMNNSVQVFQYLDEEYLEKNPLPKKYQRFKENK